ncbi:MAG: hypothetical protein JNK49_13310 [Planctomycetes bacterium]|nr:hypothetical protein [Planctomycetota bacterium]
MIRTFAVFSLALLSSLAAQEPRSAASLPASAPDASALRAQALAEHSRLGGGLREVQFDRPSADGPLWALGSAWKASFDGTGTTVYPFFGATAPRNFPLRMALTGATVGGKALALQPGTPEQRHFAVRTDRGALTEVIDTRLDQLEQSFVFETLPVRGALAVEIAMTTELVAEPIQGGLRFANEWGHIDYTKAIAKDAAGRSLPLDIQWTGAGARIEIPAEFVAEAQLPLVLDPVLNYWYLLASGQTRLQHDSDVATWQSGNGRVLLVWQRNWSATDQDCFGLMFDGGLGLVRTDFAVDFTTEDWLKIAVAGNNYAQNFLVVSEVRSGLLWWIGGRTIAQDGTVGSLITIEREFVVGTPGNNYHPDVGSDPFFGTGFYTVVFNKRTLTSSDIYLRQLTTAGGLRTTNAVPVDTSTNEESRPSISKSCGQSNGQPANFLIAYQRTWVGTPYDQEVWGAFASWNGAISGAPFAIAITTSEETAPTASSPVDLGGVRYWPYAYERTAVLGQPRSVFAGLLRSDGSRTATTMVNTAVPGEDSREPEIDSDGTRFVVTRTNGVSGYPQGVEAVTLAYLPASGSFRVEERTGLITSSLDNYGQTNICASFSGGGVRTPRYYLSFTEQTTNTFRLEAFDGTAGTAAFQTRFTQCGSAGISASGQPALGQSLAFTASGPGFTGILFGFPGSAILGPCGCLNGVAQAQAMPGSFVWTIPAEPAYVGIALAVQGFALSGSACFGVLDVSNTLDFTIR